MLINIVINFSIDDQSFRQFQQQSLRDNSKISKTPDVIGLHSIVERKRKQMNTQTNLRVLDFSSLHLICPRELIIKVSITSFFKECYSIQVQSDSIAGLMLALHTANLGSIPASPVVPAHKQE